MSDRHQDVTSKIINSNLCAGCGLCASISKDKIEINYSVDGFLRPEARQRLNEQEEKLIWKSCPGLIIRHEPTKIKYHTLWGPIVRLKAGYATDGSVRFKGSSGGVISAILIYLLQQKKVDFVVQIGAAKADPLKNEVKIVKTREEIIRNAGSRYSPSAPLVSIDKILRQKGTFALVGKPCDIAAMRQYAKYNPQVKQKIKYMLSFFCAGIPSIKGTLAILKHFNVSLSEVESLRYRGNGWPGLTTVQLKGKKKKYTMEYNEAWGKILNKNLQFRCKICPDGTGELADVVAADAWYGDEKGYPIFTENEGRSLIISRNDKGESLIQECLTQKVLKAESFDINDLEKIQPYQASRKKYVFSRLIAMRLLGRRIPHYINLHLRSASLRGGVKKNLQNFMGMVKRQLKQR